MPPTLSIHLTSDYLELYKVLKIEGFAASGAEAKGLVADGLVQVNGEPELRKRRKLISGDRVTYDGIEIEIR